MTTRLRSRRLRTTKESTHVEAPPRGHLPPSRALLSEPIGRPLSLHASLPSSGLELARSQASHSHLPDACGGQELALRRARGLRHGTLRAAGGITLNQGADEWLSAAQAGLVRNRSGDPYKPSALRGYEQSLRTRLLPALGGAKLSDIRRSDVQRLVNRMMSDGLGASTVRNSLMPLRAIYRQALALDEVAVNPTSGVQLPAVRGKRERIASPAEAERLIAALQRRDRAV